MEEKKGRGKAGWMGGGVDAWRIGRVEEKRYREELRNGGGGVEEW